MPVSVSLRHSCHRINFAGANIISSITKHLFVNNNIKISIRASAISAQKSYCDMNVMLGAKNALCNQNEVSIKNPDVCDEEGRHLPSDEGYQEARHW